MHIIGDSKFGLLNESKAEGFDRPILQEVKEGNYIEVYKQLQKAPELINL